VINDISSVGNKLANLFQSKKFKKISLILGIIFFFLTFLISFDPQPFLRFGYVGVFVFNLFGPGIFLFPPLIRHMNIFGLAFATALGMAINDSVSWLIGRSGDIVIPRSRKVEKIAGTIHRFGPMALFFWSLIPFPYDIIGLIAGYLEFSYKSFVIPTFLGKLVRFLILGSGMIALLGRS
jgi:membrane protein YqaA with SNARE-associated domain